jgi:superfamily I DNA and RNA helicase
LDYIFIDECQDFKESFFDLCSLVTSRQVFLAGDIFQSIFAENITKDYTADYFLTKCYRTDPKTLMFAHALGLGVFEDTPLRWLSNENWEACGYTCEEHEVDKAIVLKREPVRRFVSLPDNYESVLIKQYSMDNIYNQVNACIHDILRNNTTCTIEDICIILLDNNQNTYAMANMLEYTIGKEFSWKINKAYESKKSIPNTLLVSNRNNVKGLEYPFVICLTNGLHDDYTYRNAIYTMLTRSFLQTIFMVKEGDNGLTERIMQGYAEIMQEQKMTIRIPSNDDIERIATRFKDAKRRPLKDIIKEAINELGVDEQKSKKMLDVALTMAWTDCSEGEIRDKLETLNRIW